MNGAKRHQIFQSISSSKGFTMIEIVSVLILIGIFSAVIVPRMTSTSVYEIMTELETLKTHLRFAQSRAMSHNESWGISITSNSYTLLKNGSTASINLPNDTSSTHTFANGVSISSGSSVVTFDDMGSPGNSDIIVQFNGPANPVPGCSQQSSTLKITITRQTGFIQ